MPDPGWELRARWPAATPSDRALAELAGKLLLRRAARVGRRRARGRLAVDSMLRDALVQLDGAAVEHVPRDSGSSCV